MDTQTEQPKKKGKKKGSPKTGGRKKGTPNKNSFTARRALDESGINVMAKYTALIEKLPVEQQLPEYRFLIRFLYPQVKDVDTPPVEADENPDSDPFKDMPTENLLSFVKPK